MFLLWIQSRQNLDCVYDLGTPSSSAIAAFVGCGFVCLGFQIYKKMWGRVPAFTPKKSWRCQAKYWYIRSFGWFVFSAEIHGWVVKLNHCELNGFGWWVQMVWFWQGRDLAHPLLGERQPFEQNTWAREIGTISFYAAYPNSILGTSCNSLTYDDQAGWLPEHRARRSIEHHHLTWPPNKNKNKKTPKPSKCKFADN